MIGTTLILLLILNVFLEIVSIVRFSRDGNFTLENTKTKKIQAKTIICSYIHNYSVQYLLISLVFQFSYSPGVILVAQEYYVEVAGFWPDY